MRLYFLSYISYPIYLSVRQSVCACLSVYLLHLSMGLALHLKGIEVIYMHINENCKSKQNTVIFKVLIEK